MSKASPDIAVKVVVEQPHDTREGWLRAAMAQLDERFFKPGDHTLPEQLYVSIGWAKNPGKGDAIGQCFPPAWSVGEKTVNMFICPRLTDPVQVLGVLLHEMVHAAVGCEHGHKAPFKNVAMKEFGLKGKATATYAEEGTECHTKLAEVAEALGPYPHVGMVARKKSSRGSMGGWVRLMSTNEETYKVLVSPKQLEEHGYPVDPWGDEMVPVE